MDDNTIQRLAFMHQDAAFTAQIGLRPPEYGLDKAAKHLVPFVLRTGATEFYNNVPDSVLQEAARDAEHLETLRRLPLHQ